MATRRTQRRTTSGRNYAYIDGNTVRQMDAFTIPAQRDRERREQIRRKAKIRSNQQRQLLDAGFVLFLTVAVIAITAVCINFIRLKSNVETVTNQLTSVKEEVLDLRTKNDAAYNKVLTSIDLNEIRRIATENYGMVPAGKDQIITFKSNEDDYMTQYKAVSD